MRMEEKKNNPQIYLEEQKHRMKKTKMTKFIDAELKWKSELNKSKNSAVILLTLNEILLNPSYPYLFVKIFDICAYIVDS